MKLVIASDIHGSAACCELLLQRLKEENAGRMLLLGDLLYHGPRNDLPRGYAPKQVIAMLNSVKEQLFCVRGNCEAEVDQMVLDFPVMADYAVLPVKNCMVYATHGHVYGPEHPVALQSGDILLCGHTHVPQCRQMYGFVYMNPGSVSIPKEDSLHSYMTLEDGEFLWKNLADGSVYDRFVLQ